MIPGNCISPISVPSNANSMPSLAFSVGPRLATVCN